MLLKGESLRFDTSMDGCIGKVLVYGRGNYMCQHAFSIHQLSKYVTEEIPLLELRMVLVKMRTTAMSAGLYSQEEVNEIRD